MKISIVEARKQKALMEQHLCDQIQVFEERTGFHIRSLELLRSHRISDRSREAGRLISVVSEVLL